MLTSEQIQTEKNAAWDVFRSKYGPFDDIDSMSFVRGIWMNAWLARANLAQNQTAVVEAAQKFVETLSSLAPHELADEEVLVIRAVGAFNKEVGS